MIDLLRDVLALVGVVTFLLGVWMIWPAAALMIAGVILVVVAVLLGPPRPCRGATDVSELSTRGTTTQ